MAFYFSSDTNALYDTDVFPVASLPANKVEITSEAYAELLTKQNQGYVILSDGSGNPYTVNQREASATDIKHAASVATTLALGHVKIGNTMEAANDGTLDLKDGSVTTAKIVDANVTADKLASNSVTTAKITDANVTADKLASDSVTSTKIADGAVTTAKIVDANVTADKLASGSVTYNKIASNSVDTSHIVNGAVSAAKMGYDAVQTPSLADNAVTTAKIADANVTTAKIADGAVTEAKLEAVKDLVADETSLTMTETSNEFTLAVKDGGVSHEKLASTFLFWDPNFSSNYSTPKGDATLTSYCTNNCNGKSASIIFLTKNPNNTIFNVNNGVIPNTTKTYYEEGSTVLIVNMSSATQSHPGNIVVENVSSAVVLKDIAARSSALFVCLYKGSSSVNYNDAIWIAVS